MAKFGRLRFGRGRFGIHHTSLPIIVGGELAVTHLRLVYLHSTDGTPLGDPDGLCIVSGSVTENIQGLPYASGSLVVRNIDGENDDTFYSGQLAVITEVQIYPFAGDAIRTGTLGTFKVRTAKPSGTKAERVMTLDLVSPATDLTGPKLSGDLTTQAPIGVGASLDGGPVRASVEAIAGWILTQTSGGAGAGGGGLGATPAYTAWFTDEAAVDRTTGPFLIVPPADSLSVLDEALKIIGGYIAGNGEGAGSLGAWPSSAPAIEIGAAHRAYGDGPLYEPVVSAEYAPVEVPANVVITNSNAVNNERTVTVAVGGGTLKDDVQTFGAFSPPDGPVFRDLGDHQTVLANVLATRHERRHRTVNLVTISNFQDHAGDSIEVRNLDSRKIPSGFYSCVSKTFNIPGPTDSLTCWPGV